MDTEPLRVPFRIPIGLYKGSRVKGIRVHVLIIWNILRP